MQYVGEVFNTESSIGRKKMDKYSKINVSYLMKSTNNEVIDATDFGNLARFINHSCEPNCETQKWNVLGEICVGIFALRDIEENEELTFDYQFDCFNTPYSRCYCGADRCKGFLGIRPINKDQEKELEDNLLINSKSLLQCKDFDELTKFIKRAVCEICKISKDNDTLPDGITGKSN